MTNYIDKIEEIKRENRVLADKMSFTNKDGDERHNALKQYKANETKIKDIRIENKLSNVNAEQKKLLQWASIIWNAERPEAETVNEDGSFHKTKIKKYPKLSELKYINAEVKDNLVFALKYQGKRFQLFKTKYEYNKPTIYTPFESFNEFIEWHGINSKPVTRKQLETFISKLDKSKQKLEKAIEQHQNDLEKLNARMFDRIGLLSQDTKTARSHRLSI